MLEPGPAQKEQRKIAPSDVANLNVLNVSNHTLRISVKFSFKI